MTASNRCKLSLMLQLIFFLLKLSDAAPNMAISFAPAATADSKPIQTYIRIKAVVKICYI
jgi:hypothetical protein